MVRDTCSRFLLFCAVLIVFPSDATALTKPANETNEHTHGFETTDAHEPDEGKEEFPFSKEYYSYKVQSTELGRNALLKPPIVYKTPDGYSLVLEPITNFCKVIDTSIITKFTVLNSNDEVYISIDEDLTNILTSDSTIVYKLKAINDANPNIVGGETTVLIRVVQFLPIPDTVLDFEEPNYSIKLSFGRKGKVFKFKIHKTALKAKEKDETLEFEKQPESYNHFIKEEYSFKGNYSLEYVPDHLWPMLRVSEDGDLEIIGVIDEGTYNFDVVAADFGPNSSTVLKARSRVNLFIDNVAVCNSKVSSFIKAYSKHYITERMKFQTAVPATGSNRNCTFAISHQYPFGSDTNFFAVNAKTGAVDVIRPIDRESYAFEGMEEPSAYLKLKIHCPPPNAVPDVQPFHLADKDSIAYDPTSTLVQLVIVDSNDNRPAFSERRMTVGYPVQDVATTVLPRHLVQVKAIDKDAGKHGKIQYSLKGNDANDFIVNPETGTIYCRTLVDDGNAVKTFDVVARDNEGKSEGYESVLTVTVKFLTYSDIVRVDVKFSTTEDHATVESQLSEISGVRMMSLTNDIVNTFVDGRWRIHRTLTVYGVNNTDDSLVPASELERKLANNAKILETSRMYSTKFDNQTGTVVSVVYAAMFCLMLSIIALGLLYFGNGRYLSCIPSTSNTPLKDDMENMSQSNWITTFNRSNLSFNRVRLPGKITSPVSRSSKIIDDGCNVTVMEHSVYKAIPSKGKVSADNPLIVELE
ncbi:uncharacterized protein LOC112690522 isoform X2 [Sipha flava]|uniref:Uncharacterized protein LOC112690522 isoform X2 n=2 Tax=Sipha flava TaxID=143950 RepID=A0A8B8GCK4_9HEMI|nr:uncharacterized protein LOC112690522 isoform X2 [Sipha flava]